MTQGEPGVVIIFFYFFAKQRGKQGGKSCPMCWALLLQGHMLCKGGIAGILLRKTKEENPLLLQRQSHFAPQNKEDL